jgi:hypothetical protein
MIAHTFILELTRLSSLDSLSSPSLGHKNTNAPLLRSGQFRGQNGLGPLKKPHDCPIVCFAREKKK